MPWDPTNKAFQFYCHYDSDDEELTETELLGRLRELVAITEHLTRLVNRLTASLPVPQPLPVDRRLTTVLETVPTDRPLLLEPLFESEATKDDSVEESTDPDRERRSITIWERMKVVWRAEQRKLISYCEQDVV
jgi:hypothetical protein